MCSVPVISKIAVKPTSAGHLPINGLRLYHEVYGELTANTVPLLLIPGAFMALGSMEAWVSALAGGRTVIAFDQQGVAKGEQNCPPEIPQKPRDARAFWNVQGTADWGRIVAKRAISPDLITCL